METTPIKRESGGASLDFERGNTSWSGLIEVLRCDPPHVIFVDDVDGSAKYRYETFPIKQQELADGRLDAEEFREWLAEEGLLDKEGNPLGPNAIPGWWTPAPDAPLRESETVTVGDVDGYPFWGDFEVVGEGRYVLRMSVTEDRYDPDHHNHDMETYDENRFGYASADEAHAAALAWAREWHKENVEWAEDQDYQIEMEGG